jgi:hypothetical protein
MILEDRGLTPQQMHSVIGISENLIGQYRDLYAALDQPEHQRTLERLKRTVLQPSSRADAPGGAPSALDEDEKGGLR